MIIDRKGLLHCLESIQGGLSKPIDLARSDHFIFLKDRVFTCNGELLASQPNPLKDFEGALPGHHTLVILAKLPDEELEIEPGKSELILKGKQRSVGIRLVQDAVLPPVEESKQWKPCPEKLVDNLKLAIACAGQESTFACIYFSPDHLEACNNYQAIRVKNKLDIPKVFLIRHEALTIVTGIFGPANNLKFTETDTWLHFAACGGGYADGYGLRASCRKYLEKWRSLDSIMSGKGSKLMLPEELIQAVEQADVFATATERFQVPYVKIKFQPDKLIVRGEGDFGWFQESIRAKWTGKPLGFLISSRILLNLLKQHRECQLIDNCRLLANGDNFTYATSLIAE